MPKLLFLVNPHAGKGEIKGRLLELIDLFNKGGWEVTVRVTQKRLEIPALVEQAARDFSMVVCCGGDGTLNETVTGLMRSAIRPPLGYIPAGTVNDFASSLALSKNMPEAAKTILDGVPFACDVGSFEDRFFTYIAAFGAFTDVAYQTPQQSKNILGRAAYILEGIKRLPSIKAYHLQVVHDEKTIEGDFLFGMVTNSTSIGGFKMTDKLDVSMNDGLLEVLLVKNPTSAVDLQRTLNAILQQDYKSEFLVGVRAKKLQFTCSEELPWTLDGEFGGALYEARIENHTRAIQVLTMPDASPALSF